MRQPSLQLILAGLALLASLTGAAGLVDDIRPALPQVTSPGEHLHITPGTPIIGVAGAGIHDCWLKHRCK